MVYGAAARIGATILTRYGKPAGKYIYGALRAQDRIVSYTYRRTGLYNRGVVRGIQHGLIAGQIVGGTLNLGLEDGIDENGFQKTNGRKTPYTVGKTRGGQFRNSRGYNRYCRPKRRKRRSDVYSRRY